MMMTATTAMREEAEAAEEEDDVDDDDAYDDATMLKWYRHEFHLWFRRLCKKPIPGGQHACLGNEG